MKHYDELVKKIELEDFFTPKEKHIDPKLSDEVSDDDYGHISIVKVATGLGKTHYIESADVPLITCPTNDLKQELHERRIKANKKSIMTPNSVEFSDEDLMKKIETLYVIDDYSKVRKIIKEVAEFGEYEDYNIKDSDIDQCRYYLQENENIQRHSSDEDLTIVTTHKRVMNKAFGKRRVIFDEDPLETLIDESMFFISDLEKLDNTKHKRFAKYLKALFEEQKIKTSEDKTVHIYEIDTRVRDYITDDLEDYLISKNEVNLLKFLIKGQYYYLEKDNNNKTCVRFMVNDFSDINYKRDVIILSATVNKYFYSKVHGKDKVSSYDTTRIKNSGTITQYTKRSYSKTTMKNHFKKEDESTINLIKKLSKRGCPIITHKPLRKHLQNYGVEYDNMKSYFGNCSGYDGYKGRNVVVLGTPHKPPKIFHKFIMTGDKEIDISMSDRKVKWREFEFRFKAYNDEDLMNLQMDAIESDLIQAVGRARALREEDVNVEIYSNFPLYIADKFITPNGEKQNN